MLRIDFLVTGKTKERWIQLGQEKYLKRLKHYVNLTYSELPEPKKKSSLSKILQRLGPHDMLILLDEKGKEFSSQKGAVWLEKISHHCAGKIIFAAGGAYGFSPEEYARADHLLSLSQMTFTHEMVRVFFLEQLYRLMTIQRKEPYHHD